MNTKKVAAVVVTYNRKELLKECIEALLSSDFENLDIFIVDNASTDGTRDYINCLLENPRIFYFNTGKNLGGAGGFAYGCNKVYMLNNYDYCWLMDDDTIVQTDSLSSLVEKAVSLDDDFSFLASVVKWIDGTNAIPNAQIIEKDALKFSKATDQRLYKIKRSTFVSCFINVSVGKKIGLPIKEMFIYGDDTNYTYRLSKEKNGYLDVDSFVVHKMTSNLSNSLLGCEKERIGRWKFGVRNNIYNAKTLGFKKFLFSLFIYYPAYSLKILFKSKNMRFKRIFTVFIGSIEGLFFRPKIIKKYSDDIVW